MVKPSFPEMGKKGCMQQSKFDQMVREFPFLTKILAEVIHSAQTINQIIVARGDKNLLEVTPRARLFEDKKNVRSDYRWFWTVTTKGEIKNLPRTWLHMIGSKVHEHTSALCIGSHFASSSEDVDYVVEMSQVNANGDNLPLTVTVYKMKVFNTLDDPRRLIRDAFLTKH